MRNLPMRKELNGNIGVGRVEGFLGSGGVEARGGERKVPLIDYAVLSKFQQSGKLGGWSE